MEKIYCKNCEWSWYWDDIGILMCKKHKLCCCDWEKNCKSYRKKKEEEEHPLVMAMKKAIKEEEERNMRNFKFSGF
jgi:hypothetical protein